MFMSFIVSKPCRSLKTQVRGFTLLEMVVSAAIFSVVILVATSLFVTTTKSQKRVQSLTKVQGDARFILESMAQRVRLDGIDYSYYLDPDGNGNHNDVVVLSAPTDTLVIRDADGLRSFFRRYPKPTSSRPSRNALGVCKQTPAELISDPTKCADAAKYDDITPSAISIEQFSVWIRPASDPFTAPPTSASDCFTGLPVQPGVQDGYDEAKGICTCSISGLASCFPGQSCTTGICLPANKQPGVTMIVTSRGGGVQTSDDVTLTFQTTVSSRTYKR